MDEIYSINDASFEKQLAYEKIKLLFDNAGLICIGTAITYLAMAALFWTSGSHLLLLLWLASMATVLLAQTWTLHQFRQLTANDPAIHFWARLFALGSGINGIVLGMLPWIVMDASSAFIVISLIVITCGLVSASIGTNSAYPLAFFAFATPAILMLDARLAIEESLIEYAPLLLIYFVAASMASKNFSSLVHESIEKSLQNKALLKELEIKKDEAERANRQKTRFLAAASHDLRQPIHAIDLFADVLEQKLKDGEQQQLLSKMRDSVGSMASLLDSLLDMSKLDAGLVRVERRSFALATLAFNLQEEFSGQANDKHLHFNTAIDTALLERCIIDSDPALLENILRNLLSNAIKYTETGTITLSCQHQNGSYVLSVSDSGIGIAAHEQKKIFDEFYQIDNPERDRSKGIGLGLSIVKRLSHLLEHPFSFTSVAGQGSSFTICVPSGQATDVAAAMPEVRHKLVAHIMVIDDDQTILEGMERMLSTWGCRVLTAQSISESTDLLKNGDFPDLVVADFRLRDDQTGVEAIRAVRNIAGDPKLPGIIITGDTEPARLHEMKVAGFEVLHKPLKAVRLRALIQFALKQRESNP
ncbi:response regulator [Mariprofundus sp. EBB-1]|uniref:ATP-binding response regulator n=1 Tax=Mariprofundus sp. EBB-1 TaxID=2650971 RepID=UPI000EF269C6|nr:ATP-binding protein [Mariprofundus sp. EBB-1]RLL53323.1 response regulator [Mariprofundus sp. EBB-1]